MLPATTGFPIILSVSDTILGLQAEDGIRDHCVTGVQTCALPISEIYPLRGRERCFLARRRAGRRRIGLNETSNSFTVYGRRGSLHYCRSDFGARSRHWR